eukprot:CAMPEP_0113627692 /NCGR_PEP_ID=MMETSP0017_2-20120614/14344_1 /TAXON_ID=2856 /ORGANISM="Cylindrotheca closterium" /LENGTH=168 /DNA_ID=CAMNT_0000537961 /DNA_START=59 /DNA_END=565 /DNA_ORIENTATION=- /assembly_acc=CAM_ASM_000147
MNKFFLVAFVLAASLFRSADANAQTFLCEGACSEDLRITCDELLNEYTLQGSCCSLEKITAYDGCRVRVGYGNCYWWPKCGDCPAQTEGIWSNVKCGLEYQGAEGNACPASEYPTVFKDPYPSGPWQDYSCAPSAAPKQNTPPPTSASASTSVRMMALLGAIMAVAQM